ncbi:hypothetical protein ABIB82_005655 [Bradyrhizobium sp. i1.8.4]
MIGPSYRMTLAGLLSVHFSVFALADDNDDDSTETTSAQSNVYLDFRINYATVPANALSIGFSSPSLSTAIATLQSLSMLASAATRPNLTSPSSQSFGVDVPLTIDLSDRLSLYGGFTASASQGGASDWSTLAISSFNAGFQADIYQQNGGSIPTITLQTTVTRSVPDSPLATTSQQCSGVRLRAERGRDQGSACGRSVHTGPRRFSAGADQFEHYRLCRRLLPMAQQLEIHRTCRRSIVWRGATLEPDADRALYPTDRQVRRGPDG